MSEHVVYRFKKPDDGSFLSGVPQRDLTARDVERLRGRVADVDASLLYESTTGKTDDPHKMKRDELNAFAATRGIADPEKYANKEALIAAIEKGPPASGDGDNAPSGPGTDETGGEA